MGLRPCYQHTILDSFATSGTSSQSSTKKLIMSTENTSLKNTAPAGDSTTTNEMVTGKSNTYQRTFLIVAGSLLALLVLIAVAGTSGGQHLTSSEAEIAQGGAGTLVEYQADTTDSALTQDIFGLGAVSENEEGCDCCYLCFYPCCKNCGNPCSDFCTSC